MIVAGNRDEFHARPTQDMHWWADKPDVLGGRDLQAGGTWLGLGRNGRFATVTNYRDADQPLAAFESRGALVTGFIESNLAAAEFLEAVDGERYAGFNLVVFDGVDLAYLSNRGGGLRMLPPGYYGVANATLDSPWPKVERSKAALESVVAAGEINRPRLLRLLDDRERARVAEVETGGLSFERAHALSAPFIVMPDYGTRCSTVVLMGADGRCRLSEKRFDASGVSTGQSDFEVSTTRDS